MGKRHTEAEWDLPRKANECFIDARRFNPPRLLFDEFWREGELAMLFGGPGTGKSVLAVQIAEALGRGRPMDGFQMRRSHRRVLYLDLDLSDVQFQARYSFRSPGKYVRSNYRFAENFYRGRLPMGADLCQWLRAMVPKGAFQVVIIDSLSAIKKTHDGVKDTLPLMRDLANLKLELGISILVVAGSDMPLRNRPASEADLGRSRILCGVADSVFAVGPGRRRGTVCLTQTRSRCGELVWDFDKAPVAVVERLDSGMVGFRFDHRFAPIIDEAQRTLICRIKQLRDSGKTYKEIEAELGVSPSTASRLRRKWIPSMGIVYDPRERDWNEMAERMKIPLDDDSDTGDEKHHGGLDLAAWPVINEPRGTGDTGPSP